MVLLWPGNIWHAQHLQSGIKLQVSDFDFLFIVLFYLFCILLQTRLGVSVNMLRQLTWSGFRLCFVNVSLSSLGVAVLTVTFVLMVSVWFFYHVPNKVRSNRYCKYANTSNKVWSYSTFTPPLAKSAGYWTSRPVILLYIFANTSRVHISVRIR